MPKQPEPYQKVVYLRTQLSPSKRTMACIESARHPMRGILIHCYKSMTERERQTDRDRKRQRQRARETDRQTETQRELLDTDK